MKFLKVLFTLLIVLIIVSGLFYVFYPSFFNNMYLFQSDVAQDTQMDTNNQGSMNMSGMDGTQGNNVQVNNAQSTTLPNPFTAKNREKMTLALNLINQALELITIDPYSQSTMPSSDMTMDMDSMQTSQGTGTINIYPDGNSSVNISREDNTTDATSVAGMTDQDMGNMDMEDRQNFVFDQGKLQQLHSGIFTMAQGVLAVNELNDDLLEQSMQLEVNPLTYQTYVTRYNVASQNLTKLENAIEKLSQASVLINVNPYGSPNGYAYNTDSMRQLHEGIYKLAQGMATLNSLKDDFYAQMSNSAMQAQNQAYNYNQMDYSHNIGQGLFANINMPTVLNLIIIVLVVGLILGIIGAILSMFNKNNRKVRVVKDNEYQVPSERGELK